jgi:hypothetical protein
VPIGLGADAIKPTLAPVSEVGFGRKLARAVILTNISTVRTSRKLKFMGPLRHLESLVKFMDAIN